MIRKIKDFIRKFVFHFIKPNLVNTEIEKGMKISYSQAGEDLLIKYLFQSKGITNLKYLDIGTNHPYLNNNTYLFYKNGSRGVCVEADKTLIREISRLRPEDEISNVGVSIKDAEECDFYIFNDSGLNTFSKKEAEFRHSLGTYKIASISRVRLETVDQLIAKYFSGFPDLISLDIEGLDLDVLKSIDWNKFPVPVVCTETCTYSESHIKLKDESIQAYMNSIGYFAYADTYINTIFVNRKWFGN